MKSERGEAHFAGEIERWVMGDHDGIDVDALIAHLSGCDACSEEARRQAVVEMAVSETARAAVRCPDCQRIFADSVCSHCGASAIVNGSRSATPYVVERVLVKNAHGRIYVATAPDGRTVALKELAFVQVPGIDVLERFEREARVLSMLHHTATPHFVESFQIGEGAQTRLYLAQEFIEGESLAARMARSPFSETEIVRMAREVLDVLVYLQSFSPKIFHRDVKPENLIVRIDGSIAVVDFGSARDLGSTVGATLVGTFGFMPVEQLGGIVDATTDPYALGASLFHLLTRREPWTLLDPEGRRRLADNASPGLARFIDKLTAAQPRDRFADASAARAEIDRLSRASSARPARGAWRLGPRLRRHASRIGMGTLALACSAIGAGAAMFYVERLHHHVNVPTVTVAPEEPRELPDRAQDAVDQLIERLRRGGRTAAADELSEEAEQARDALRDSGHENDGHLVFGRVVFDPRTDREALVTPIHVVHEGYFVTPVLDLSVPLPFRLPGHRPKDVPLSTLPPEHLIGLGDITLERLAPGEGARVTGKAIAKGGAPIPDLDVKLYFNVAYNHPTEPVRRDGDGGIQLSSDAEHRFRGGNIPPGAYTLVVDAPGLATDFRPVTLEPGQSLDVGTVLLGDSHAYDLAYKVAATVDELDDAAVDEADGSTPGPQKDSWVIEPNRRDGMAFFPKDTALMFDCPPCRVQDLGAVAEKDFRALEASSRVSAPVRTLPIKVEDGHVYLVKREAGDWLLFRIGVSDAR